jgi:hypothetical protein
VFDLTERLRDIIGWCVLSCDIKYPDETEEVERSCKNDILSDGDRAVSKKKYSVSVTFLECCGYD